MKQINLFFATLVLTGFALFPAAALADDLDDLDVTMTVFDSAAALEGAMSEMQGPETDDGDDESDLDEEFDDHEEGESDRDEESDGREEDDSDRDEESDGREEGESDHDEESDDREDGESGDDEYDDDEYDDELDGDDFDDAEDDFESNDEFEGEDGQTLRVSKPAVNYVLIPIRAD